MQKLIAATLLALAAPAGAQGTASPPPAAEAAPAVSPEVMRAQEKISLDLYREQLRLERAKNTRLIAEDGHAMFTYWKQSVTDVVLTLFVMIIVSVGVYLSYLQFRADNMPSARRRHRDRTGDASGSGAEAADKSRTDLKISKSGLELSSSVIGLFILLASMFFFYLYIEKVYPVNVNARVAPSP